MYLNEELKTNFERDLSLASTIANLNFPSLPALAPSWIEVWTSCRGGLHRERLFVHFRRCRKSFCACKPPAPFGKCVIKWWFVTAFLPSSLPNACVHRIEVLWELLGGTGFSDSPVIFIYFHINENCLQCTTSSLLWIKMHFGNLSRFLAHLLRQLQSTERLESLIFPFL